MRRSLLGLVLVLSVSALASEARAQIPATNVNDPFFQYYAFYLPRSQALANQQGPEATINALSAQRQAYSATNRNDMFDPSLSGGGGFFDSDGDFLRGNRQRSTNGLRAARHAGNLNGLGPQGYFGGSPTLKLAYPNLRSGRGRNANVAVTKGRSGGGGGGYGGGLGGNSGSGGLPGPR